MIGETVANIVWCRSMFNSLNEKGVWGIPRSGVVFQKIGNELVLTECMPHDKAMPITAAQLKEQQDGEFEAVKKNFGMAGITVRRKEP